MRKRVVIAIALIVVALLSLSLGATHIDDTSNVNFGLWLFYSAQRFVQIVLTFLLFYMFARLLWGIARAAWHVARPR